ncbi:pleckstrin homology domain-containing family A member 7-like isoform X5 [Mercenaria mercenaria]|uniref:pleckstrin homology domain-containing family A member 7-like isoform X5 n=1 Tax=Mercenaria mercenaria TaxID=6596 RepID=UPI00234FAA00|nr:pleckstrin homology domain-containing family A member 7-like isoform X5 [Mercenaria mercenaria]
MEGPTRTPPQSPLTKGSQHRKSGKSRNMKAPAASREENSKVILRGWLQKQESGGLKMWKKKWCVLADFGLFFYKDDSEQTCIGSILLPSYKISPCSTHDINKKHAFKAEHENMKTFFFAAENQREMEQWVEALKMASLVQRAPGLGHVPKLIPKSPIMSWNDNIDSPGISPPDMQQFPFANQDGDTPRGNPDNSFIERSSLQARENIQNYSDPYQRHRNGSGPSSVSSGTLPRDSRGQGQGQGPGYGQPSSQYDPRYPGERTDRNRSSQRSSQGQGLPDDQRSMSSVGQRSGQYPSSTMPRDMRPGQPDNRSSGSLRGQGYNSLPRDQRSRPHEGQEMPHRANEYRDKDTSRRRREDNPYMTMMSPQTSERKMDPLKHSNRPLPQEPRHERPRSQEPSHEKGRSGGGDYASLTRIRDKWPNQQLSDSGNTGSGSETARPNHLSPTQQQRPDLYVDIPHTYVNVYDESQVRDQPPELPSRPPLPVEMRHQIVEDIAKTHSPNTQRDMITAENNLELRMKQPTFFNYPTPVQESLPAFPQESPRSQYSQRSQRSQDPRSHEEVRGQPQLPRRPDTLPGDHGPGGQNRGQGYRGQGQRGQRQQPAIHTVKEDPDMPDSQVIETDLPKKVFPLNGPRLRMSISATDLLGKTHDELVLLLIQLRRDKAELNEQRDGIRKTVEQNRPAEFYYRKLQNEGRPVDGEKELQHRRYMDLKHKLEEVEKKLEVYKPLVNLVCNMVTMGSLYGGDNLMLATEYRKHLLSPEQYSPPKKMLEFSRKHQEDRVIQEIEEDVKHLTQERADLEEKLNRLYDLDKVIQDQSFQVTSLKEDREMLERALGGLLKKQDQHCTNPRELDKLIQQQKTVEKELSRVLQQLAEASKELEETTAENNKLEHEVALLRSKVHGNVSRSKSAPSLSSESLRTKMKMEKDLAKVKNIMAGLSQEGARLQEMMSTLRKPKSATDPQSPTFQKGRLPGTDQRDGKKSDGSTYYETDLDNGQSKDLAQVTALLASYHLLPGQPLEDISLEAPSTRSEVGRSFGSPPPSTEEGTSAFRTVSPSRKEDDTTYHASLVQATFHPSTQSQLESGIETDGAPDQWDIGEADDNTKRFFDSALYVGLIPKNMPKQQTVRDVKRISETRKEGKKREDSPPLRVGVIPSDYNDNTHVYENLPQQKSTSSDEQKLPWAALLKDEEPVSGTQRRRSNLHLMTPKPFSLNSKPTPYSSVNNVSSSSMYNSQNLDQSDAPLHNHNTQDSLSQSFNDNLNNFENNQSNDNYKPTEQMTVQLTNRTPPPPPVRGTSKYITADVSNLENLKEMFKKSSSNRNYEPPVPAILKGRNARNSQKGRYLTISSSEPIKLEQNALQSPKLHSQAGDLITSMDIPDIVKSSTTKSDLYDERTIDREILYFPEKVEIPERYIPDSDDESITEEEKAHRREKANKIKKILTQQSVHSLSQPDVSKVAGEVHERVQQEKQQRALLLGINQELAEQVKRKSRQYAAERRKTWSGTTHKADVDHDQHAETDDEYHGDANNNSYNIQDNKDMYFSENTSYGKDPYSSDIYSSRGQYGDSPGYFDASYNSTSYTDRPNFKI